MRSSIISEKTSKERPGITPHSLVRRKRREGEQAAYFEGEKALLGMQFIVFGFLLVSPGKTFASLHY